MDISFTNRANLVCRTYTTIWHMMDEEETVGTSRTMQAGTLSMISKAYSTPASQWETMMLKNTPAVRA